MTSIGIREAKLFSGDWHLLGDFFDFFCGTFIGEGSFRIVYEYRGNPKQVVKIAKANTTGVFDNVSEIDIYNNIRHHHPQLLKFLAKPIRISSCGRVMIMEKTKSLKHWEELPKRLPAFLADIKPSNWGTVNGRIVCHDYANHNLYKNMNTKIIARR